MYSDMEGVVADFDARIRELHPEMGSLNKEAQQKLAYRTCEENPRIFSQLDPVKGGS